MCDTRICDSQNYNESDEDEDNLRIVIENQDDEEDQENARKQLDESPGKNSATISSENCTPEKDEVDSDEEGGIQKILKAFSDERVVSLVKEIINPEKSESSKEEKLTRAKRRLLVNEEPAPLSWMKPTTPPPAEIQQLITEDLQEDSSGDEYIPTNDDMPSDDDEPCTPKSADNATQTNWTEDGLFKVPSPVPEQEENLNIALRTRSKLSLNETPLQAIEDAFIPPDITTDMYDLNCDDDDVWNDFLKKFLRPIDEIVKAPDDDDEDHDPEYNDQEEVGNVEDPKGDDIDLEDVDLEDLKADDLEVSNEELNALLTELFGDDVDNNNDAEESDGNETELNETELNEISVNETTIHEIVVNEIAVNTIEENESTEEPERTERNEPAITPAICPVVETVRSNNEFMCLPPKVFFVVPQQEKKKKRRKEVYQMFDNQKKILTNQMAQHVQLLTQNYLQTYAHFDYHKLSSQCYDYLQNLHNLGKAKTNSHFHPPNLAQAVHLVNDWKALIDANDDEVQRIKTAQKNYTVTSLFTFPELFLKTVSRSEVFHFVDLLPTRPFIPKAELHRLYSYTLSEDRLIAFEMDQFAALAKDGDSKKTNEISIICKYISEYVMPHCRPTDLYQHIAAAKKPRTNMNPIRYYLEYKKLLYEIEHKEMELDSELVSPLARKCEELRIPWKDYIYPETKKKMISRKRFYNSDYNKEAFLLEQRRYQRKYREKSTAPVKRRRCIVKITPKATCDRLESCFKTKKTTLLIEESLRKLKFNSSLFEEMDMPLINVEDRNEIEVSSSISTAKQDEPDSNTAKDNLEDINALMIASSTINNQKRRLSAAENKRKRIRREFASNLSLLVPENLQEERANLNGFVQAFYDKVQNQLDVSDNNKLMQLLCDFEADHSAIELVKNIDAILTKYPELAEQFLSFLTPAQAHILGKFVPYFMVTNMSLFLHKLEIYFKDQPSQVKKIYKSLEQLSESVNLSMEKIKTAILPLLKGNKLLTDWFLQLFPLEKPPPFLLNGPSENLRFPKKIDVNSTNGLPKDELYETITIPDAEDPYGGPNCICNCHANHANDETFKSRQTHCQSCGTKFIQGRVYIPTDKGLRLAKIVFNTPDAQEHYARLGCIVQNAATTSRKRADTSPSKTISTSPIKDQPSEEIKSLSSDDDGLDSKKKLKGSTTKSPRKRKLATTSTSNDACTSGTTQIVASTSQIHTTEENVSKEPTIVEEAKASDTAGKMDWDCNVSIESTDVRLSPEHINAVDESESEFCEESSQDNLSDCEAEEMDCENDRILSPVHSDNSNSNPASENVTWTREEDRIILQTLQSDGNNAEAFKRISDILENRTIEQIKSRFGKLINLLQEMAAGTKK